MRRPVDERPDERPDGAGTGRRARWALAFRLARREVRRHPWRHALVVVMIVVPVLSAMVAFSAVSTWQHVDESQSRYRAYGADIRLDRWNDLTQEQAFALPRVVPEGSRIETARVSADWLTTDRQRPDGRGPQLIGTATTEVTESTSVRIDVRRGHLPGTASEIFLTESLAELGGWQLGDEVSSGRSELQFTVSGIGTTRDDVHADLAVLGDAPDSYWTTDLPGFDVVWIGDGRTNEDEDQYIRAQSLESGTETFIWLPPASDREVVARDLSMPGIQATIVTASDVDALVGPGMAMVFAALSVIVAVVASAAFAIASRRQLRNVGLLSAAGADPATVRAALMLQGALPGLAAAGLALLLGAVAVVVLDVRNLLERWTGVQDAAVAISVGGVALAIGLGVLAGTLAAWQPARTASRVPVLSALAGRRPIGPVPTGVPLTGLAFVAGGGSAMVLLIRHVETANASSDGSLGATPLLLIAAMLAMLFGLIALAPTLVATVGTLSRRASGTSRIALRGIARHRVQSSAAVAAVAVCLAVPVGVLTTKASVDAEEAREHDHMIEQARSSDPTTGTVDTVPAVPAESVRADVQDLTVVVQGDLTSPDLGPLVAEIEAVTGPLTRVPLVALANGSGGWYSIASIDPAAAPGLLSPWAAQEIAAGRAVALEGSPGGPVTLDDDVDQLVIDAATDPEGTPLRLTEHLDADYLVPATVFEAIAVGRPPLNLLLVRPSPITPDEAAALAPVQGSRAQDPFVEPVHAHPTLDELRAALARARAGGDQAQSGDLPGDDAGADSDVWFRSGHSRAVHDEYLGFAESAPEPLLLDHQRNTDPTFQRWLRIVALVAGGLSLLVLTITLSLRAVDSVDDHRAAVAAGAPPSKIRRQHAFEGTVLASLGALLALPLGWLPVTAVRFGQVRRRSGFDAGTWVDAVTQRLHLPGWELVPILVAPAVFGGLLWLVVPWLRSLVRRGAVDQVLPRY